MSPNRPTSVVFACLFACLFACSFACSPGKTKTATGGTPGIGGAPNPGCGAASTSFGGGDPGAAGGTSAGGSSDSGNGGAGPGGVGGSSGGSIPILEVGGGLLKVEVCAENVIRVAFAKSAAFFTRASLATAPKQCVSTPFTVTTTSTETAIATAKVTARIDNATGDITFTDPAGQVILAEKPAGRTLTPATIQCEDTTSVRQEWTPNDGESLYGLGQHQHGL
ncbi:MAG TPA: hypothetical protein VHU40_01765, partial [Polyangia bacterium]|nr:hypothetical protein [Polyangia bacterium]